MSLASLIFFIIVACLLFNYLTYSDKQTTKRLELIVELTKEINKMEGTKEEKEKVLKNLIKDKQ